MMREAKAVILVLAWLVQLAQRCSGMSIKSMQIWSQGTLKPDGSTSFSPMPTGVYAWNLEATPGSADGVDSSAGARAPISRWTSIGCFKATGLAFTEAGSDPLRCTLTCNAMGFNISAMKASECSCLKSRNELGERAEAIRCDTRCFESYYNGTTRLCGGTGQYYSAYQKYDYVHQTAQGCYDPWRFIWYQSVSIETYSSVDGIITSNMEWYLHAASVNSGDPLFPYHQAVDTLFLGLQYDLDNSRIVGLVAPYWKNKPEIDTWSMSIEIFKVTSILPQDIKFSRTTVTFTYDDSSGLNMLFGTGITALDSINNILYITVPVVPQVPGLGFIIPSYSTKIYGINLDTTAGDRVIVNQELQHNVVLLEVNSKYHDLFALLLDDTGAGFYYVKLGESFRNNRTLFVDFNWMFTTPLASVVNPYSYQQLTRNYYQIGSTTVDHVSNTSFVVFKETPNADSPTFVKDLNQRGFLNEGSWDPLQSPNAQATWLVNTDPMIPLTLAAPKLQFARFTLDGRSILVHFDSFTVEGALPVDNDGDFIPDAIDWSTQHIGVRNCSDMFSRQTANLLGDMPQTTCEWRSGTEIQIHLSRTFSAISVGDGLFLKDSTIYSYLSDGNEWSNAASGGISVGYPDPLSPPTIDVTFPQYVDLCSSIRFNGEKSNGHGGAPVWYWALASVRCENALQDTPAITQNVRDRLESASEGGEEEFGQHSIGFGRNELEPGCMYNIAVTLKGRWGLNRTSTLTVHKKAIPAPQVTMQGPSKVFIMRSRQLVLQTQVEKSNCESLAIERQTLKFQWTAEVESENTFNGALTKRPVDLNLLNLMTGSASLVIGKLTLEPDATYTMSVRVGYERTWYVDPSASTIETVTVRVTRTPIKVHILGGSRKAVKSTYVAIDSRQSLDPDYPSALIERNPAWVFTYNCTTLEGVACFPLNAKTSELPDVKDCQIGEESFKDMNKQYVVPSFSSSLLSSESYYCKDPTKNGILIVNLPNTNALQPGNYTFTIFARANNRLAVLSMVLEVTAGYLPVLGVLVHPLEKSRASVTESLRVTGELVPKDRAQYANSITYSWSFFREEANPRWSQHSLNKAIKKDEAYLVPRRIFMPAAELDVASRGSTAFDSDLSSSSLVIKANVLQPSSVYAFRLTASAAHPFDGEPLLGYADLNVITAGPPPVPGGLNVQPPVSSVVDFPKNLTAVFWTAEDVPLQYMFSYKSGLSGEFSTTVDLRVDPINAPTLVVRCFKQGDAVDNYNIQINVTVTSLFGASTSFTQLYQSLPPEDPDATNKKLLTLAQDLDPESRPTVLSCITLDSVPAPAAAPAPGSSATTTTTTSNAEQRNRDVEISRQMIEVLKSSTASYTMTASVLQSNLAVVTDLAQKGFVPDNMADFVQALGDHVGDLAESGESVETVDRLSQAVLNTLGSMGAATAGSSNPEIQARSVNANSASRGVFFPASQRNQRIQRSKAASSDAPAPPAASNFGTAQVSGTRAGQRRLADLYPELGTAPRRLSGALDEAGAPDQYIIQPGVFPDWSRVPTPYQDPDYTGAEFRPRSVSSGSATPSQYMYELQEKLELEWISFINATDAQAAYTKAQSAQDDEYFANYSAHLGTAEREIVVREWWEERARVEALKASTSYQQSRFTQQMFEQISSITSTIVKMMVTGENVKNFNFPMGLISVGKTRDLVNSGQSFKFEDSNWKIPGSEVGAFGFGSIKFTEVNPMAWATNSPKGPFLVNSLEVYRDDGTFVPVQRESQPLSIMSEHSSFASASCFYWDWQANNGLGGWSQNGVLNNENGCSSTHLGENVGASIIGMFLDVIAPDEGIEIPSSVDTALDHLVTSYNIVVIAALCGAVVLSALLHFWALKQDEQDFTKPMDMKRLGDGITKPNSQDDPVYYSPYTIPLVLGTFWNLLKRDHVLVAILSRCPKQKTTRLQKVSVFVATIAGTSAVCALFYGEHIINPKHYIEVGIVAAVITYPMVRSLRMMFSSRPFREAPPPDHLFSGKPAPELFGPLEAVPDDDDDELEEEDDSVGVVQEIRSPSPLQGSPMSALGPPPQAKVSLPAIQAHSACSPPEIGGANVSLPAVQAHSPGSAPEVGAGPESPSILPSPYGQLPPPPPGPAVANTNGFDHGKLPPPPPGPVVANINGFDQPPLPPPAPLSPKSPHPNAMSPKSPHPRLLAGLSSPFATPFSMDIGSPEAPLPPGAPRGMGVAPPAPPMAGPRPQNEFQLAIIPAPPLIPAMPDPEDAGASELDKLQAQSQLLRRVRKMYIEKVIKNSEKLAYDERVDMRSSLPHPMGGAANVLAYTAVICYWATALTLTAVYTCLLNSANSLRWFYSCFSGWAFILFVLEIVRALLVTILELQQLNQRRRFRDHKSLKDQVDLKKAMKLKQMRAMAKASGMAIPQKLPQPPPVPRSVVPYSGDASAG